LIQGILLTGILFVINYFAVGLVRGEIRLQHIKKYHYDYYDNHPNDFNKRLWHNFKHVIIEGSTIFISILMTVIEAYFFVFK